MVKEIDKLDDQIHQLKKELILTAEETGLISDDTLNCSRKLDQLITTYQVYLRHSYNKIPRME
jgi:Spo0E like sporulation regulatory protein